MKVEATLKNLRIAPRKSRLVVGSVIGMPVEVALVQLAKQTKRTSLPMLTLLKSAIANAENNFGLDRKTLFVKTAEVGEGPKLKRWKPKASDEQHHSSDVDRMSLSFWKNALKERTVR
jgi:large subunit ribosomal protein L22